jgi:hypothetical protein
MSTYVVCIPVQSFFAVDQTSGEVTVMRNLDRDVAAVVRITVLVTDTTALTTQQGKGIFHHLSLVYRFMSICMYIPVSACFYL